MVNTNPEIKRDAESCRDGRDLENGRDLEVQPLVQHSSYDPNSRWHKFKAAVMEPPKSTVSIYADIPFNHVEWKRHRNAAWRHRLQPILFMRVAGGFWWQLTYSFIVSLLVGLYHHRVGTSSTAASKLSVPFNLTTFALSLLLVFRTNSSYSRWWEARQIWGAVVNLSRNFARQSMIWLPQRQARLATRWIMAAPYLLKCHLRFNASVRENVSHVLLPQELDWVLGWTHRPNAAAHVMSTAVLQGGLDTIREKVLMELVNNFIDCVGKCERIFKTPIPAAYTRHTSRYLMIYLTACPLVLWPSLQWWTLVASVLITFLLLGTENIGVQIEEPFRVLPLDDMCRGIEATIREMERQHIHLEEHFGTWVSDPAGLPRSSSESSLDSFQDGPTDGPSEPAALDRFHHIPPPAPIAAAAAVFRKSIMAHSLTHVVRPPHPSTETSTHHAGSDAPETSQQSAAMTSAGGASGRIGVFVSHARQPGAASGGSVGGSQGGIDEEGGDVERGDGKDTSTDGAHSHYPYHVHHAHRRLPHHPADVPGVQQYQRVSGDESVSSRITQQGWIQQSKEPSMDGGQDGSKGRGAHTSQERRQENDHLQRSSSLPAR